MATPKILLLSRRSLEHNTDALKQRIEGVNVQMAVAVTPEDAQAAQKLTDAVAQFQYVTAIVADFEADMIVNDDGSLTLLGYTPVIQEQPSVISEV